MSHSRAANLPNGHLLAEVASFPFGSEAAFRASIVALSRSTQGATAGLWRDLERALVTSFPALSLDEAVSIRDEIWFGLSSAGSTVPLGEALRLLAGRFLELRGPRASPRPYGSKPLGEEGLAVQGPTGENVDVPFTSGSLDGGRSRGARHARGRRAWRWLSFAMPPDLLLAALGTEASRPVEIDLVSESLATGLRDRGFAEIHLHVGAGFDFRMLWVGCVLGLASPEVGEGAFCSPGAGFAEGRYLGPWLLRAAMARWFLAAFLAGPGRSSGFETFYASTLEPRLQREFSLGEAALVRQALRELNHGSFLPNSPTFGMLQASYARLIRRMPPPALDDLDAVQDADPIVLFLPRTRKQGATPEMRFVGEALRYIALSKGRDDAFERLFWQTTRLRTVLYRHVTQRPLTPGLQWFIRHYARLRPIRRVFGNSLQVQSAAALSNGDGGLRALELRTCPDSTYQEVVRYVKEVVCGVRKANQRLDDRYAPAFAARETSGENCGVQRRSWAENRPGLEAGIIMHFAKSRGEAADAGVPPAFATNGNADPGSQKNQGRGRFVDYYLSRRKQATALGTALTSFPWTLRMVRGVDVCTDELGVPNWVLGPMVRFVRQAGAVASERLLHWRGERVPGPRTTVHCGEDFVHLLGGLRRVDDAIESFRLREGDRIGHGVSLGIDPGKWAQQAGRLAMPREERLFDLAWEWQWYTRHPGTAPAWRWAMLSRFIPVLATSLFGKRLEPVDVCALVEDLRDERALSDLGYPTATGALGPVSGSSPGTSQERRHLLWRYLLDRELFVRGQEIEWVEPAEEAEALALLQGGLRKKIGELGLVVEVNPSSNLLIGNLADLTHHPLWRLNPPSGEVDAPPVAICIGSDDPITFATSLQEEYQLLHDAMTLSGLSSEQASQWLDRVRFVGLDSRFTLPLYDGLDAFEFCCHDPVHVTPMP